MSCFDDLGDSYQRSADSVDVKSPTQSSKPNGVSRSTSKPSEGLHLSKHPEAVPQSPPPSDFKLNDPSRNLYKHVRPDWSQSMDYDLATKKTPEIPTQLIPPFPENPTHHLQLEGSENSGFQNRTDYACMGSIQPSTSRLFDSRPDWSEPLDCIQGPVTIPQMDWSQYNDLSSSVMGKSSESVWR